MYRRRAFQPYFSSFVTRALQYHWPVDRLRAKEIDMKKRKKKVLDVGKEARRQARKSGVAPAATRVIPDKRKRPPKHEKKWLQEEVGAE